MVAIKAHQAAKFLTTVGPAIGAVLLYGPDAGSVAERAQALAKRLAGLDDPPGEVLRLDDADLESDPGRLAVELRTFPMFGGRNVVRAAAGRRLNAQLLKPLVTDNALAGFLIVEAGNLRRDEALRLLFERASSAAAIPCYADEARDLEALVRDDLAAARLGITPEARKLLLSRLGADRALSRREIEKLTLYAAGQAAIEVEDVEAIVGDASEQALDKVAMACAEGQAAPALAACDRAIAAGEGAQSVILAIQRHFTRLDRVRALVDQGRSVDEALRQFRPPLHFKIEDAFRGQSRLWSKTKLTRALRVIAAGAKAARLVGTLEQTVAERLILDVAAIPASGG